MREQAPSKDMSDRELLRACLEAMRISQRNGRATDWQYMIDAVEKRLSHEPPAVRPNLLRDETSAWEIQRQDSDGNPVVTCHTRVIGGVLCRWWGDGPAPSGVDLIDRAAQPPSPEPLATVVCEWIERRRKELSKQGITGGHYIADLCLLEEAINSCLGPTSTKGDSRG